MMNIEYVGQEGDRSKRRQHCTYCKNHGQHSRKTNHKCQYESCSCLLCQLTRLSRLIMRHQQRLWRHLKDARRRDDAAAAPGGDLLASGGASPAPGQSLASSSKQQKCDMCRNHGFMKEKRAHKNACPYQDCSCALCGLTRKRRDIMRHQQRVRRSQVTSQQRDEAYDYVMQTTAELAKMTMEAAPTLDTPSTTTSATPNVTPPATLAPTCSSASVLTEYSAQTPAASTTSGDAAPFKDPPPLELLENSPPQMYPPRPDPRIPPPVEPRLHYEAPSASLDMGTYHHLGSSPAWRNLKRDRNEVDSRNPRLFRDASLFKNFDFMKRNNFFGREESVRNVTGIGGYDSVSSMNLVTCQEPSPFRTQTSATDSSLALTAPSKKSRFTISNEDLHLRYSQRFWGSHSMETSLGRGSEDVQHVGYRRMSVTTSPELRLRSPPALIPLPQNQPVRPHPVRPPTFPPSMDWDPVSLPYLAYSLLHTRNYNGTLPTSTFGLGKVAPFLHSSVP
uniref:IDmrt1 n=1 Tax=Sagmariasus verreauxi TaxID=1412110 RepID=A0A286QJW0_9EUCA|nr:iDmrt1 [Sagmariasus verreauxi]